MNRPPAKLAKSPTNDMPPLVPRGTCESVSARAHARRHAAQVRARFRQNKEVTSRGFDEYKMPNSLAQVSPVQQA